VHGRPLVNGAPDGSVADQARLMLLDPKEPGTASALSLLGVTAIVLHPGGPADVPVQPREPAASDGYRLVGRFPDTAPAWAVAAPPAVAGVRDPLGRLRAAPPPRQRHDRLPADRIRRLRRDRAACETARRRPPPVRCDRPWRRAQAPRRGRPGRARLSAHGI